MRKRKDFTFDERTIEFLEEMAKEDCTTMSSLLEMLVLKEARRRIRRECVIHPDLPVIPKDDITPEDMAQLIVNKLIEKRNGGDIPQDFKILEVTKVAKEKRWKFAPPLETYKILIGSSYKGIQAFVYYPERKFACRITKSGQRMHFLSVG